MTTIARFIQKSILTTVVAYFFTGTTTTFFAAFTGAPTRSIASERTTFEGAAGRTRRASVSRPAVSKIWTTQEAASSAFLIVARTTFDGSSVTKAWRPGSFPL